MRWCAPFQFAFQALPLFGRPACRSPPWMRASLRLRPHPLVLRQEVLSALTAGGHLILGANRSHTDDCRTTTTILFHKSVTMEITRSIDLHLSQWGFRAMN